MCRLVKLFGDEKGKAKERGQLTHKEARGLLDRVGQSVEKQGNGKERRAEEKGPKDGGAVGDFGIERLR